MQHEQVTFIFVAEIIILKWLLFIMRNSWKKKRLINSVEEAVKHREVTFITVEAITMLKGFLKKTYILRFN